MRHVDHLLAEYHDDELSLKRHKQVEAHLRDCPMCRAELERLNCLSGVLAEYTLPGTLTAAEIFRAQVALRVSRRKASKPGYASWAWHLVPLSLICLLVSLQALLALPDVLELFVSLARWSGLPAVSLRAFELGTAFGYTVESSLFSLLKFAWRMFLYFALFLVFVPYVGWVSILWRSRTRPITLKGDSNGPS